MKTKHVFWGLLFVTIGVLVLLNNLNSLRFEWYDATRYWPLVLVLLGISIMIPNKIIKAFVAGISAILLAVVIFAAFKTGINTITDNIIIEGDNGLNFSFDDSTSFNTYVSNYDSSIKTANLKVDAGGGYFKLIDSTDELIKVFSTSNVNYSLTSETDNNGADLNLKMEDHRLRFHKGKLNNKTEIMLNTKPAWNLDLDIGASSVDMNLTKYNINNLKLDVGAASIKIKLGEMSDETNLKLKAGVSSIDIEVPENVGCEIRSDVNLSSKHYSGFNEISSSLYRTENFSKSGKKIFLSLDTGVSSITVSRYGKTW